MEHRANLQTGGAMTLEQLAAVFDSAANTLDRKRPETVSMIGDDIAAAARGKLGEYQGSAAPFRAWEPLAESTIDNRIALGYSPEDPGRRSGDGARSIETNVTREGNSATAHVGTNLKYMRHFEEGTKTQPPRSFLGSSAVEGTDDAVKRVLAGIKEAFK